ncbi:MAG TPA: MFS transporter, partial [Candidatus Methylomirabilis sp.]|nr:MFS transporter [Candidatus Methylomirabilis sp.]
SCRRRPGWGGIFGRKRFLLTCILLFTAASALCGAAPRLDVLILARVLQGLGGGVAPILGPTLGGWITETYTWRWVFYINLPVGALACLMVQAFVDVCSIGSPGERIHHGELDCHPGGCWWNVNPASAG